MHTQKHFFIIFQLPFLHSAKTFYTDGEFEEKSEFCYYPSEAS